MPNLLVLQQKFSFQWWKPKWRCWFFSVSANFNCFHRKKILDWGGFSVVVHFMQPQWKNFTILTEESRKKKETKYIMRTYPLSNFIPSTSLNSSISRRRYSRWILKAWRFSLLRHKDDWNVQRGGEKNLMNYLHKIKPEFATAQCDFKC